MLSPIYLLKKSRGSKVSEGPEESSSTKKIKIQNQLEVKDKKTMADNKISTENVKELRDQTGISIMQCKKALEESGGDFAKALVILRNKSGELAAKKSDRIFKSGTISAYIHSNGNVGTIVELLCESDFVSNNEEFKNLARDIAMHITATNPRFLKREDITEEDRKTAMEVFTKDIEGKPEAVKEKILEGKLNAYFSEMVLMDQAFIKNPEQTIQDLVNSASQKFGEKMAVGKFKRFKVLEN